MSGNGALRCAQCNRVITVEAITVGDGTYCCIGCVARGACVCDRPAGEPEPIHLEAGPFPDQAALLGFARELEAAPEMRLSALALGDPGWARFAIVAPSAVHVVRTIRSMPGFSATVEAAPHALVARLRDATPPALGDNEELLPARTRFRVFRPSLERPRPPSPWRPAAMPPPPSRPPAPAAQPAAPASEPARPPSDAGATADAAAAPSASVLGSDGQMYLAPELAPAPPAQLALVVAPFHSFTMLSEFLATVRGIEGVRHTRVRRFAGGTLHLAVEYAHAIPLADRLGALHAFRWRIAPLSASGDDLLDEAL